VNDAWTPDGERASQRVSVRLISASRAASVDASFVSTVFLAT